MTKVKYDEYGDTKTENIDEYGDIIMSTCKNKVIQVIEKGYDVKEVRVPCGSTSIHGERLLCNKCLYDKDLQRQLREQDESTKADQAWLDSSGWGEM